MTIISFVFLFGLYFIMNCNTNKEKFLGGSVTPYLAFYDTKNVSGTNNPKYNLDFKPIEITALF